MIPPPNGLVDVLLEVPLRSPHVGPADRSLQLAPERLDRVGIDIPALELAPGVLYAAALIATGDVIHGSIVRIER